MNFLSVTKIMRVMLAAAVALWMAGAGCMLGCENMVVAASNAAPSSAGSVALVVSGDACASKPSHDCCAKHKGKPSPPSTNSAKNLAQPTAVGSELGTSSSMMDCPLAVNASAALSKAKQDGSGSVLLLTHTNPLVPSVHEQASALSPPARLPNRGHTYLRCCVFLI